MLYSRVQTKQVYIQYSERRERGRGEGGRERERGGREGGRERGGREGGRGDCVTVSGGSEA